MLLLIPMVSSLEPSTNQIILKFQYAILLMYKNVLVKEKNGFRPGNDTLGNIENQIVCSEN